MIKIFEKLLRTNSLEYDPADMQGSHWYMYTSIWCYLRVLPVPHRPEVVDIGVYTM